MTGQWGEPDDSCREVAHEVVFDVDGWNDVLNLRCSCDWSVEVPFEASPEKALEYKIRHLIAVQPKEEL